MTAVAVGVVDAIVDAVWGADGNYCADVGGTPVVRCYQVSDADDNDNDFVDSQACN